MIPKLDFLDSYNGLCLWQTTDGVVGASFDLASVDIEAADEKSEFQKWTDALRALPTGLVCRVETHCSVRRPRSGRTARFRSAETLAAREYRSRLHIQTNRNPFLELIYRNRHGAIGAKRRVEQGVNQLKEAGLDLSPLGDVGTTELFERTPSTWVLNRRFLSKGASCVGVVRLFRPSSCEIPLETTADILKRLPAPFTFTVNFQKCSREVTTLNLQKRLKQETGSGKVLRLKRDAVEDTLAATTLSGEELLEYELIVTLERTNEGDLSQALLETAGTLRPFGDVVIETVGVGPSVLSTMPGVGLHVPLLEGSSNLPLFLPVWRQGARESSSSLGALSLHRRDRSLDQVNLLSREHQNANLVIVGNSGRGKSVLLGCLTTELLSDPSVRVIKVDVGGSHSKECELLGGREYRLNLETTAGLNPFALVRGETSESVRATLAGFIEALVLKEDEQRLPKEVRAELDDVLKRAMSSGDLSVDRLMEFDFSRQTLLSRWATGGLYGRVFQGQPERSVPRLRYFNFQDIFQASDQDFAQAAMAAVLAIFDLEMRLNPDSRIALICDETPFFIEKRFDLFKTATANVRKFGGLVILVTQLSKQLIVNGDTGLLENSNHRILFATDGELDSFQERFRLRDKDIQALSGLEFKNGKHSEFLYQTAGEARVMRLELSPEEYWRVTSSASDRTKLLKLVTAVPGLTTEEAIRCLSVSSGRF